MPAIIDSAPACVTGDERTNVDDMSDFILQANYQDCAGFMTFGPGTTWGDGGAAAATSYYVLIWIGAIVVVAVFIAWIVFENRRLVTFAGLKGGETPPGPGTTSEAT